VYCQSLGQPIAWHKPRKSPERHTVSFCAHIPRRIEMQILRIAVHFSAMPEKRSGARSYPAFFHTADFGRSGRVLLWTLKAGHCFMV
jgi:hypothetical protein